MPILTEGLLGTYMAEAVQLGGALGVTVKPLTAKELVRFGRAFERQFVRELAPRSMADIHLRHIKEALLGAMIAKEQMNAEIDGELPASNKIQGPVPIRACWLGIGDDWEDVDSIYAGAAGVWTTGAPQNWIHSGSTLMGGTAGNGVRIGLNAVHVIYGLYSLHASPKIESVQLTIDDKAKPVLYTHWAWKTSPGAERQQIKELDTAFIWKKDTKVLAKVFISKAFGLNSATQEDFPALYGVSYIKEPAARLHDPVTGAGRLLPGTTYEVIHTT